MEPVEAQPQPSPNLHSELPQQASPSGLILEIELPVNPGTCGTRSHADAEVDSVGIPHLCFVGVPEEVTATAILRVALLQGFRPLNKNSYLETLHSAQAYSQIKVGRDLVVALKAYLEMGKLTIDN